MGDSSSNRSGIGKLSVVMPALNEAENISFAIESVLQAADARNLSLEIIVIDDGSTDETRAIAQDFTTRDERVKVVSHRVNRGIGAAFWSGVDAATGEFLVMLPGDNENPPEEIFRYVDLMDHVDLVIPYVYNKDIRSWARNKISYLYQFIINASFAVALNYTNGTVIYRRRLLASITPRSEGFFFQSDAIIRLVKAGCLFCEVPYRLGRRQAGQSKAIRASTLKEVAKEYARLVARIHIMRDRYIPGLWEEDATKTAERYPEGRRRWLRTRK